MGSGDPEPQTAILRWADANLDTGRRAEAFNTTAADIDALAASLGLTVLASPGQDGVGTTHAGNRYDWFLVSPDLASEEAETCRVITFAGDDLPVAKEVSDHVPVVATFSTDEAFRDRGPD